MKLEELQAKLLKIGKASPFPWGEEAALTECLYLELLSRQSEPISPSKLWIKLKEVAQIKTRAEFQRAQLNLMCSGWVELTDGLKVQINKKALS